MQLFVADFQTELTCRNISLQTEAPLDRNVRSANVPVQSTVDSTALLL